MALIEKSPWEAFWTWLMPRIRQTLTPPVVTPPAFEHPSRDVVWRQDGPEASVWVEIVQRSDGLYSFTEWKRQQLTAPGAGTWESEFPIQESGLYATQAEARQAIPDLIDWVVREER